MTMNTEPKIEYALKATKDFFSKLKDINLFDL